MTNTNKSKLHRLSQRSAVSREAKGIFEVFKAAKKDGLENISDEDIERLKKMKKTPSKKKQLEAPILKACHAWLRSRGLFVWRQNTGKFSIGNRFVSFGLTGAADITGILPDGRRLEIEVKKPGGRQTGMQKIFEDHIVSNNGVYLLVHSVEELRDAMEILLDS